MEQQYTSRLFEHAVDELASLPGIGRKTALRLALFLLRQDETKVQQFVESVSAMRKETKH